MALVAQRRGLRWVGAGAMLLGLSACSGEPPIRIGYLGGLTDRASTLNEAGRNAVILGIEQRNAAGGVAGRRLELIVQDHGGGVDEVPAAFQALVDARVDAVIGPYPSAAAMKVQPLADATRVLALTPLASNVALAGRHDYMIRLNRTTRDSARSYAQLLHARGHTRLALARELWAVAPAQSWSEEFRTAFTALGGAVVAEVDFGSETATWFEAGMRQMLAARPDGLLFIATAADAARLAQQAAKLAPGLPMAAVEWAGSATLLELGGRAVEGMVLALVSNPHDVSPRYRAFHAAYLARFGAAPGFDAVASYDAVTVLADALARAKAQAREPVSPRDAVLRYGPYEGLQQTIHFDRFGDANRAAYYVVVRNGRFQPLP